MCLGWHLDDDTLAASVACLSYGASYCFLLHALGSAESAAHMGSGQACLEVLSIADDFFCHYFSVLVFTDVQFTVSVSLHEIY